MACQPAPQSADANQPGNARDLELKWVFQSRSLEKHEVTPLVVDGVMYTIQSPNDVVALDAATGKQIWIYSYTPDPAAEELLRTAVPRRGDLGDKMFLAALDARMIAHRREDGHASCGRPSRPAIRKQGTRSRTRRSSSRTK